MVTCIPPLRMKSGSAPNCVSTTHGLANTLMTRTLLRAFHVAPLELCYLKANTALMVVFEQQLSATPAQQILIERCRRKMRPAAQAAVHSGRRCRSCSDARLRGSQSEGGERVEGPGRAVAGAN